MQTALLFLLLFDQPRLPEHFVITVVDEETGRGVPLVELRTVHGVRHHTDSNGIVAFHEPGLMGQDVFFHVSSHGYEFPKDGFGFRGRALRVVPGGNARLTVRRINIAERLYRVTGGGIYRDSLLTGVKAPVLEPLLNGQVLGSDSVLNAEYGGQIYWFWGDTNRPAHPLGNFHVPGATSDLPGSGGLNPEIGINLRYFLDQKGFAKPTAQMPGQGPTWLTALAPLKDREGRERLYASYVKVQPPLKVYARGLAVFDDAKQAFEKLADVDMRAPLFPSGHAFRHTEVGVDYVYFAHPFPLIRVRASAEAFARPEAYEGFTCLREGTRLEDGQVDRDAEKPARYAWKRNTPPVSPSEEARLVASGKLQATEARWQLRDRDTGKSVIAHSGSVCWNDFRRRWILFAVQSAGTSFLGEVWYAEADSPVGPWAYAVKIVTHDNYSFYNPKQHPMFDKDGSRFVFFEGTYSHTFSGNSEPTPRYDYNQILYKLDLAHPRLALPVPVYELTAGKVSQRFATGSEAKGRSSTVAFYAPDQAFPDSVPILYEEGRLRVGAPRTQGALFHALPPTMKDPPAATAALYEYRQANGGRCVYSVDPALVLAGFVRAEKPLCLVWRR